MPLQGSHVIFEETQGVASLCPGLAWVALVGAKRQRENVR